MNTAVITVSQLNKYVKSVIDGDKNLNNIFVCGEISNCRLNYSSGHYYFSLKDNGSVVKCVMFRTDALHLKFSLQDGMNVLCRGRVSLYEKDGAYQFYVSDIQPDGFGSLAIQFEQIKNRLESEGLFDSATKRSLPELPEKIAVLTAESGAAIHDITNIIFRRFPLCEILLVPVTVQGIGAAEDIINKLEAIYKLKDIDIIIIGRGGGSAEDLSAFNNEDLARKLKESPVPTVSAVGHETDFSITDLVADVRASTPSVAAELCVPDKNEVIKYISSLTSLINLKTNFIIESNKLKVNGLINKKVFKTKISLVDSLLEKVNSLSSKISFNYLNILNKNTEKFKKTTGTLCGLNPLNVLSRGYSVTIKNGIQVKSVSELCKNDNISIMLNNGIVNCTVNSTEEKPYEKNI